MSVERFSPSMPSSTSMLAHVSDWGTRLIAPLGSSLMSKDGMLEVAGRTYWIFGLVIAAVVVAREYGYLTGRATPTDSSSTVDERCKLKRIHDNLLNRIETSDKGFFTSFRNFTRLERQLMRLIRQREVLVQGSYYGLNGLSAAQLSQQIRQLELQEHDILLQIDQQSK
jgi:hypothetical protein